MATCVAPARARRCRPGRRRPCRCTGPRAGCPPPRPRASASSITGCKRPSASSRGVDATIGWRSRLLGVSTTSGSGSIEQQRRLPAQQVEVLRGRRAVGDAQVDVGGELQETFRPRARVVRALALRSRAAAAAPATASVPTWRAPRVTNSSRITCAPLMKSPYCASQITRRARLLHVVAELEADGRVLGERAVVDLERRPRLRQRLQRE